MRDIIEVHFPGLKGRLVNEALNIFYQVRDVPGLKKKPSTSELLDWIKLLLNEDVTPETLRQKDPTKAIPPLHGALLKNEQDVALFERLAFMARRPLIRQTPALSVAVRPHAVSGAVHLAVSSLHARTSQGAVSARHGHVCQLAAAATRHCQQQTSQQHQKRYPAHGLSSRSFPASRIILRRSRLRVSTT
jgi:arsenate reductase-like glutaredoxin family protein